jgi:hypothetical protein
VRSVLAAVAVSCDLLSILLHLSFLQILQTAEHFSRGAPELVAARSFLIGAGFCDAQGDGGHALELMAALRRVVRCGIPRPDAGAAEASLAAIGGAYMAALRLAPVAPVSVEPHASVTSTGKRPRDDVASREDDDAKSRRDAFSNDWELRVSRSMNSQYWFSPSRKQSLWHDAALPEGWAFERSSADGPKVFVHLHTGRRQNEAPS